MLMMSTASAYAQGSTNIFLPTITNMGQPVVAPPHAGDLIPGQYIVVLRDGLVEAAGVSAIAAEIAVTYGGELLQTYGDAPSGFAVKFPGDRSADAVMALSQDE